MRKRNIFLRAHDIFKAEGFIVLLRQILLRLRLEFLLLPFILIAIPGKKFGDLDDLINYGFKVAGGLIRPLQVKAEIKRLLAIVGRRKPRIMIEIGTFNGGTLFLFPRVIPENACIISIDFPDVRFGGGYEWWKSVLFKGFVGKTQRLTLIRADSHKSETLENVKRVLNGRVVDFMFIDGDHSYEGVKSDFEMYSPLVSKNGFIALHDIAVHPPETGCEVNKFWSELTAVSKYKYIELIENRDQAFGGIGIIVGEKCILADYD
jgi:predicted O-methyltransferase YrrM